MPDGSATALLKGGGRLLKTYIVSCGVGGLLERLSSVSVAQPGLDAGGERLARLECMLCRQPPVVWRAPALLS
jgi:hypothetical protein